MLTFLSTALFYPAGLFIAFKIEPGVLELVGGGAEGKGSVRKYQVNLWWPIGKSYSNFIFPNLEQLVFKFTGFVVVVVLFCLLCQT